MALEKVVSEDKIEIVSVSTKQYKYEPAPKS